MSGNDKVTAQARYKAVEAALEEVSLQMTAECGQRRGRCYRDGVDVTCCGRPFQT